MPRQPRISSLSATSSQALEPALKRISLATCTLIRRQPRNFWFSQLPLLLSCSAVACQRSRHETFGTRSFNNAVDHTAAPETSLGNKTLFTSGSNAKVVIAKLIAFDEVHGTSYLRKEAVCYRENRAASTEPLPTTNQALLISRSTSDPGNPEVLKKGRIRLSARVSNSSGSSSKHGLHIANASDSVSSSAAIPCCIRANGSTRSPIRDWLSNLSYANHAISQRLSIVLAQGLQQRFLSGPITSQRYESCWFF